MKSIQIIKRVNQTEIGKGGTHETYVLVPRELDVSQIFTFADQKIDFYFPENKKNYGIRLTNTSNQEKRIVGLGDFYRDCNINAGDSVIFELKNGKHIIRCQHYTGRVILQRLAKGFECLSGDVSDINSSKYKTIRGGVTQSVEISFRQKAKKRKDSPLETTFYDVFIGERSIHNDFSNNDLIEIIPDLENTHIDKFCSWEKHELKEVAL